MKYFFGIALYVLSGIALQSVPGFAEDAPGLDYPKINAGIASLIPGIIANDPFVQEFSFTLDPNASDLLNDALALKASTLLKRTTWSEKPTLLDVGFSGKIDVLGSDADSKLDAKLGVEIAAATEALPMLVFVATTVKAMAGCDQVAENPAESSPLQIFLCAELTNVEDITDMEAAAQFLPALRRDWLAMADQNIALLTEQLAQATTDEDRANLQRQIDLFVEQKIFVWSIEVQVEADGYGNPSHVHLASREPLSMGGKTKLANFGIALSSERFMISIGLGLHDFFPAPRYLSFKSSLIASLMKFAAGDTQATATIKSYAQTIVALVKGYTNQ